MIAELSFRHLLDIYQSIYVSPILIAAFAIDVLLGYAAVYFHPFCLNRGAATVRASMAIFKVFLLLLIC
jgi:hypothetical protein